MEIKVKTAEEFRDAHVTIEIRAADQGEAALVAERLYTAAEVGDAQASEAELVAAPLRRRIEELVVAVQARDNLLSTASTETREAEERATENREWAERAEGRLASAGLKLKDAERTIQILSDQLGRISGAVHSPEVATVLGRVIEGWEFSTLAGAVRKVRDALGSRSPAEPTSQA